ncbi:MAG: DUF1566 domain-containing protein [Treponema sp.]|jgi:hypothetical protein|nr:DUF1566 domain-containing protein [Treponema sp.]
MKRIFFVLFALLVCMGLFAQQQFKIGDTGPAGGIVFYDKGFTSDGWRYLEAAPAGTEVAIVWGPNKNIAGTETAIGTGRQNTRLIIAALGAEESAARLCVNLNINWRNDWFLPSIDELDLMYKNLKQKGLGGFEDGFYWSSSQDAGNYTLALTKLFSDGNQYVGYKDYANNVRAIRAF